MRQILRIVLLLFSLPALAGVQSTSDDLPRTSLSSDPEIVFGDTSSASSAPIAGDGASSSQHLDVIKAAVPIEPAADRPSKQPGVNWRGLTKDSLRFLIVMHAFRSATERGTREAFGTPWFQGWFNAAGNLHGYGDKDPFVVNYIGHPMQGAVSSYIWGNNDRGYGNVYFSKDSRYWKGKLRGAAFAYVNSVQFEIGPLSEASIGNIQSYYPQQGFVDHIITPVLGMGWAIGEDALDRYVIRSIESRTASRFWRIMARSLLNPSRSFANLMGRRQPWYRTNRPAPSANDSASYFTALAAQKPDPPPGVAPFEFHAVAVFKTYLGSDSRGNCVGGGAGVGFRIASQWQIVTEVNGCSMTDLPVKASFGSFTEVGGDSLTYVVGPRWSSQGSQRWAVHAQFLIGGTKITQEHIDPEKKLLSERSTSEAKNSWPPPYADFARAWDNNAFAVVAGAAIDRRLNRALALRVAVDYSHTWNRNLNDISYRNSLQFSSGLVLKMGTW